ncbi:glycosyltransferase involved in cell wall biosynthesis [Pelomonas saccharophila]|uniref:Glycosyltransferase involved in cell wall biosynthesis n=1 Tax=Roseateles saccharophilus TaxID=304 RepID=A0ABU1YSL9_ROSSA|nr:glycosyltransferase [Roseateles saccharophilus]MDR7271855.1 glycosyltransferase involved in cell wall biosynthesis [Roseateles saccharophilus]
MVTLPAPLILYAPNVHTGGGLVLLQELLDAWPSQAALVAWLDGRARAQLRLPAGADVQWVQPTLASRWRAEVGLAATVGRHRRVLCFHGLPPLLARPAATLLYLQNRNYLGGVPLHEYGWKVRLRNRVEQWISRWWRSRVDCYYVQSPTMARALRAWWPQAPQRMLPLTARPSEPAPAAPLKRWDFVYVADGQPHKNHRRLVDAWRLLAAKGIKPSLALTLTERDAVLREALLATARAEGLNIQNLPPMKHAEVQQLYADARALVFPSLGESFGLPLVEAAAAGLPVIAGERDFVRDICTPVETFDPESPISIARAVRRFLGQPEPVLRPLDAAEFLREIDGGPPR